MHRPEPGNRERRQAATPPDEGEEDSERCALQGPPIGTLGVAIMLSTVLLRSTARTALYSTTTIIIVLNSYMLCVVLDT